MSTSDEEDHCPFCLRHPGVKQARTSGLRFCPTCGGDWSTADLDLGPDLRSDAVVRYTSKDWRTGPVPALGRPELRAFAEGLERRVETLSQDPTPIATSDPALGLKLTAGLGLLALAVGLAVLFALSGEDEPVPVATVSSPSPAAGPPTAPHGPLPSPRLDPERRSLAVKQAIDHALSGQPPSVEAEIGVKVELGVAFLSGRVDSQETLARVVSASGETFGVRAVDSRAVLIVRSAPRVHTVIPGETLSGVALRYFGRADAWRRIYELNPALDPNLIRVGQPLSLPADPDALKPPSPAPQGTHPGRR